MGTMVKSQNEDLATTPETALTDGSSTVLNQVGFVVLNSAEAPSRVGAFIGVRGGLRGVQIFGRGAARADDRAVRLHAVLQRPGENVPLPPFDSPSLSRTQLEITRHGSGLAVRNTGQCALLVNGAPRQESQVAVGDVLEIGRQLVLLCVERPQKYGGPRDLSSHQYGDPDEHGIVGESPAIWQLRRDLAFVAGHAGHVLICGDSGSGKELVAAAIHRLSRPDGPWIARNAGTLAPGLLDIELFGNAKRYPNDRALESDGLIGAADRGSLFLDELAELPAAIQSHLLRVTDAGEYQRPGETMMRHSSFRLIASTNRSRGELRADMLARFAFQVRVPNLAARREDIPLLVRHWLRVLAQDDPSIAHRFFDADQAPRFAPGFVAALVRFPFAGNVRELRNLLWEAISCSHEDRLVFPQATLQDPTASPGAGARLAPQQLQAALAANGNSLEKTWRALGLSSRYALMRLMKKNAVSASRQPRRS